MGTFKKLGTIKGNEKTCFLVCKKKSQNYISIDRKKGEKKYTNFRSWYGFLKFLTYLFI